MPPAHLRGFGVLASITCVACGGRITTDDFEDLSEPCVSLAALSDCGAVTLELDGGVVAPCSWGVGLRVQDSQPLAVALDCRVMRTGRCWEAETDPDEAVFSLKFGGACCERLEDGDVLRIDVGIGCPPAP